MDFVIIVAGGSGTRMGGPVPKQFLPLCGRPVLMHTLARFHAASPRTRLILVLPEEQQARWRALCAAHGFAVAHTVVAGGATRFESARRGLAAIPADAEGLVGVHDGVRPFVNAAMLAACCREARQHGAAVPVVPLTDSLRRLCPGGSEAVPRSQYCLVQTPQVFQIGLLRRAYAQPFRPEFTDDASVVEALGASVACAAGSPDNIKLTTPKDMAEAEAIIKQEE